MAPNRVRALAAVCRNGVAAGTIDSRKGRAIVTPAPRRNVRRERYFFVMNMISTPVSSSSSFGTVRSERLPGPAKKNDTGSEPNAERSSALPAYHNIEPLGPAHMSKVFRSPSSRTRPTGSEAPAASPWGHGAWCRPRVGPKRRSASYHQADANRGSNRSFREQHLSGPRLRGVAKEVHAYSVLYNACCGCDLVVTVCGGHSVIC